MLRERWKCALLGAFVCGVAGPAIALLLGEAYLLLAERQQGATCSHGWFVLLRAVVHREYRLQATA